MDRRISLGQRVTRIDLLCSLYNKIKTQMCGKWDFSHVVYYMEEQKCQTET